MRRLLAGIVVVPLGVAGCGVVESDVDGADSASTTSPSDERIYTTSGAVLEDGSHGPQLCFTVMESYPPQCDGTDITNWDWNDVQAKQSERGTTWGTYTLVGTYDGTAFTLTESPSEGSSSWSASLYKEPDFSTPCDPPEGGWVIVDPELTTGKARRAAGDYVESHPDGAGVWLDLSISPAYPGSAAELDERRPAEHPSRVVLNVRLTGDLDRHEAELREIWGGALCVSPAKRRERELRQLMNELLADPNNLGGSVDIPSNEIHLQVMVDDGLQERLDEEYGKGTVHVAAFLRPVE